ncbi:MAG: hypothetical protein QM736_03105 [Vicinamibacterales bacterium]
MLKFAMVEASEGRVGSMVDNLLLYCYHYDPMTGRYGIYIMRALRIAGVATVLMNWNVHSGDGAAGTTPAEPRALQPLNLGS